MIGKLVAREVRRGLSGPAWLPAAFFLLVATLVPFAVGPDVRLLERIGGGALWIAALTAALLPVERLIEPDRADGVLDQLFVRGVADESVAAAKIAGHWLAFGPLLLVSALVGALLLGIPLLIFGAAASGDAASGALLLEAAVSLLIVAGAPFVAGAAIRAART